MARTLSQKKGFSLVLGASASSTSAEVDVLFDPRGEGRGGFKPRGGGRGGGPLPPAAGGGGGGRGPFLGGIIGGGGGPDTGGRGPPEGLNGGGGGGGGDGAEGGGRGGGGGAALPGPIGSSKEFALPGGGFSGGNPIVADLPGICEDFSANVTPPPAIVPTGISIFESPGERESM